MADYYSWSKQMEKLADNLHKKGHQYFLLYGTGRLAGQTYRKSFLRSRKQLSNNYKLAKRLSVELSVDRNGLTGDCGRGGAGGIASLILNRLGK